MTIPPPEQILNILIVDANPFDCATMRHHLDSPRGKTRFVFHQADTAEEAIVFLEKRSFDCVFISYQLPDADGISILRKFYSPETDITNSPVVMLTAEGNEAVMLDALRLGAQDYLVKENISGEKLHIAIVKARELFETKRARRQAEEQLQHTRKMEAVGQLTSGIAHDFNNLLTVIVGNLYLLRRKMDAGDLTPPDFEKRANAIEAAANRGTELVRRLMLFARQSALAQEITDTKECLHNICELIKSTLGGNIEVKAILKDDSWPILIDQGEFESMILNFAINARDAMPNGGRLTIETDNVALDESYTLRHPDATQGDYVVIAISDTGIGMSMETRRRVFEPFFTTKPPGDGTGLGMSMAWGFVQQCGGHIHVYSEEGHGTVFRIYLPRFLLQEEGHEGMEQAQELPRGAETILVTDDDEFILMVAVSILEKLGYKVMQAKSARMALEMLKREHRSIDLVLTDIVMPDGMSGIDLVKEMRAHYPQIKAIYASGYTMNAIPDYHIDPGDELISKPYRREDLALKVRQVLDHEQS